jgi:NAD(P)-dependent dehydrogenase (short-subunit alcohol dehydrogenase family)
VARARDGSARACRALAATAAEQLGGRIDILVNNAGNFPPADTLSADPEMFDRVYAVNVKTPSFLTQAVVPAMVAEGAGVIVNLGSWVARLSVPVGALYASTKGAMETLTRAWAAVTYLCSDDAAFVHGTVIDVDGGRTGAAVVAR